MLRVTDDGTASATFSNYPIKLGGKTGTAQVAGKDDNGVFIAFAPYEKPEIAIAMVIEQGKGGSKIAPIALDVMNQYFYPPVEAEPIEPTGVILK